MFHEYTYVCILVALVENSSTQVTSSAVENLRIRVITPILECEFSLASDLELIFKKNRCYQSPKEHHIIYANRLGLSDLKCTKTFVKITDNQIRLQTENHLFKIEQSRTLHTIAEHPST